jgi:hypothetical protein
MMSKGCVSCKGKLELSYHGTGYACMNSTCPRYGLLTIVYFDEKGDK